jgi:hypothetical protein
MKVVLLNSDYQIKLNISHIKRKVKTILRRTMAKSQMQNVVMIMFMIISIFMFDFAHANDTPSSETLDNAFRGALCVGKCALNCADHLGNKIHYAACVGKCGLKCHRYSSHTA